MTTDHIDAVDRAMASLAAAMPYQRAGRLRALIVASVNLEAEVRRLHGWLQRADDYLTAHPELPDFQAHEDRYLSELQRYTRAHNTLGQALIAIGRAEIPCRKPEPVVERHIAKAETISADELARQEALL
jgi:hypothetical protein